MIKPEIVEYWNGNPSDGIMVDWAKVRKNYKKISPRKYWHIVDYPFENYAYNLTVSERTGYKTTQILLIGLIAYAMYGVQTEYFRETEEFIIPKALDTLFNPIIENHYLEKIFGDQWNAIQYRAGFFKLIHRDPDTGKADRISSDYFMHTIANDQVDTYKSSYSTIRSDLIFFDEFVGTKSRAGQYRYFRQNLVTVLRMRQHGVIFMMANNLNFNNDFYADFKIRRRILTLDAAGDQAEIDVDGTLFYFRILPPNLTEAKQLFNRKYFGYAGSSASSITGGKWEINDYPHIRSEWTDAEPLSRNFYISHLGDLLRLTLCAPDGIGLIVLVTPATRIYDDSRIFTCGEIRDQRYIFKCGSEAAGYGILWKLYRRNRWYYARNEDGELVQAFLTAAASIR